MVDPVFGVYEIDSCPAEKMNVKHKFSTSFPLVYYLHSDEFLAFIICAEDAIYLAYSDFHPYLLGDSACIKELNQWFVKQLDTVC